MASLWVLSYFKISWTPISTSRMRSPMMACTRCSINVLNPWLLELEWRRAGTWRSDWEATARNYRDLPSTYWPREQSVVRSFQDQSMTVLTMTWIPRLPKQKVKYWMRTFFMAITWNRPYTYSPQLRRRRISQYTWSMGNLGLWSDISIWSLLISSPSKSGSS